MVLDEFRLDGKVALVTGAARGLGATFAVALAEAGADLALVTRRTPLDQTVAAIRDVRRQALEVCADLTSPGEREHAISQCVDRFGSIDILVNNAGVTHRQPAHEYSLEAWNSVVETNATAVFHLSQLAARRMLETGKGKIIHL